MVERESTSGIAPSLRRAALLGFVVGLPTLSHPPTNDDRFDPFRWGADYAARPLGIVTDQLGLVRFHLTTHGNFRPVGRILERAQDTVVWLISDGLGLPMHIVLRLSFAASMAILAASLVVLVAALTMRSPSSEPEANTAVYFTPLVVPILFVASGRQAPIINFADIYLQTMALAVLVSILPARSRYLTRGPLRAVDYCVAAFAGGVVASFNEMGLLAMPLAVAVVGVRGLLVHRVPLRGFLSLKAVRLVGAATTGFMLVFAPVRLWLFTYCQDNYCYAPSLIRITTDLPIDLAGRAIAWLPPLAWPYAVGGAVEDWWVPTATTAIVLIAIALSAKAVARDLQGAPAISRDALAALGIVGATMVLLGAALGALSLYVQTRDFPLGSGWRDTVVTLSGGAVLIVALASGLLARWAGARQGAASSTAAICAVAMAITTLVNQGWTAAVAEDAYDRRFTRLSLEMMDLDPDAEAGQRRCTLVDEILEEERDDVYLQERLEEALDMAATRASGRPFCDRT